MPRHQFYIEPFSEAITTEYINTRYQNLGILIASSGPINVEAEVSLNASVFYALGFALIEDGGDLIYDGVQIRNGHQAITLPTAPYPYLRLVLSPIADENEEEPYLREVHAIAVSS